MSEYTLVTGAYNSYFRYYTEQFQDKFIAHLFNFKKNGYFLDIGSGDPDNGSNSKFFDTFLDWQGICIDLTNYNYSNRKKTKFYCVDATKLNYEELLKNNNFPNVVDYLSLDADTATNDVLKILPIKDYIFSSITIEHDLYKDGEAKRNEQRQVLSDAGYHLLCANVCLNNVNLPWEDWWINPKTFPLETISFLQSDGITINQIIDKFNK